MVLSDIDRKLLDRCIHRKPHSWEDFVDRFVGLVIHVIRHTAKSRSVTLTSHDEEDLAAEFFSTIVHDDFAILRRFRGESSLATYLTVIARRVVVREILKLASDSRRTDLRGDLGGVVDERSSHPVERIGDRDELKRLLGMLDGTEADIVRLYHLEGKSYREISTVLGMPENSIGPTLSRARDKLRQTVGDAPTR